MSSVGNRLSTSGCLRSPIDRSQTGSPNPPSVILILYRLTTNILGILVNKFVQHEPIFHFYTQASPLMKFSRFVDMEEPLLFSNSPFLLSIQEPALVSLQSHCLP